MQSAIQSLAGAMTLLYVAAGLMSLEGAALVLPAFVELPAGFTSAAAAALAVLMLLSLVPHIIARDNPNIFVSLILFALASFLVYGRWALVPLQ